MEASMSENSEQPSPHPAVRGRERSLGRLTEVVRRLAEVTVVTGAPADELDQATGALEAVAARLAALVPATPPPRFPGVPAEDESAADASTLHHAMPFDPVVGAYNPVAPPVLLESSGTTAVGRARYGHCFEGAPGWVHGAAIAAAFDMVLTAANRIEGVAGPTVRLTVRYRRPTLLAKEAVYEGWVAEHRHRRVLTAGQLVQDGVTTVEAEGEFAPFDPSRLTGR
jgi:acyl-coenzyme A thioesterase PaaI-like protein